MKLVAINIADSIDLKKLKASFGGKLLISTSTELFYKVAEDKFISFFNYGVVAFSEHTQQEIDKVISSIKEFIDNEQDRLSENIEIEFKDTIGFEGDTLIVPQKFRKDELFRIVLFDLGQSVALDYYSRISDNLLQDVKKYAAELEQKGKISMTKKEMMKFIGKSMNTMNKIVDNLYIFDSPDITWESEKIDKVHKLLVRNFDLNARFKEIEYTFTNIDKNLQMFKETYEHQHSATLEIVVIILILIEIINSLSERFHLF